MEERNAFYRGYLSIEVGPHTETVGHGKDVSQDLVNALEREVRLWSPACSIFWSLWGVIQAEEQVAALAKDNGAVDFDYLVRSTPAWLR